MPNRLVPSGIIPAAFFAAMALLLTVPAWLASPMVHDSFWIDQVWSQQFTTALREGNLYPRWLPLSFGGLGAPVFYYYAPLSFHAAGLFGLIGLPTYPALIATFAAAWFASGMTMYLWLRDAARWPIAGALLFMVLPYHVIDFYGRGALAEFCAITLIPLVAMGVRHALAKGRALPLALAYAALIMTHLPTAALTGALLIAPQAAWFARKSPERLWPVARGIAAAIGGSAIYLAPALTLQHHSSLATMWSAPFLRPANWGLLHPGLWPNRNYVLLFAGLALVMAIGAMVVAWKRKSFWPLWTIGVGVVVMGLLPGFWSLPVMSAVQFPWRALALAEFGFATAIAGYRGSAVVAVALLTPLLSFTLLMATPDNPMGGDGVPRLPVDGLQEVVEYLPAGAVDGERVVDNALIARAAAALRRTPQSSFRFPSLRGRCGDGSVVSLRADPTVPLVMAPPPGCTRTLVALPAERIGLVVSLLSWGSFAVPALRPRRRGRLALQAYGLGSSKLASP